MIPQYCCTTVRGSTRGLMQTLTLTMVAGHPSLLCSSSPTLSNTSHSRSCTGKCLWSVSECYQQEMPVLVFLIWKRPVYTDMCACMLCGAWLWWLSYSAGAQQSFHVLNGLRVYTSLPNMSEFQEPTIKCHGLAAGTTERRSVSIPNRTFTLFLCERQSLYT